MPPSLQRLRADLAVQRERRVAAVQARNQADVAAATGRECAVVAQPGAAARVDHAARRESEIALRGKVDAAAGDENRPRICAVGEQRRIVHPPAAHVDDGVRAERHRRVDETRLPAGQRHVAAVRFDAPVDVDAAAGDVEHAAVAERQGHAGRQGHAAIRRQLEAREAAVREQIGGQRQYAIVGQRRVRHRRGDHRVGEGDVARDGVGHGEVEHEAPAERRLLEGAVVARGAAQSGGRQALVQTGDGLPEEAAVEERVVGADAHRACVLAFYVARLEAAFRADAEAAEDLRDPPALMKLHVAVGDALVDAIRIGFADIVDHAVGHELRGRDEAVFVAHLATGDVDGRAVGNDDVALRGDADRAAGGQAFADAALDGGDGAADVGERGALAHVDGHFLAAQHAVALQRRVRQLVRAQLDIERVALHRQHDAVDAGDVDDAAGIELYAGIVARRVVGYRIGRIGGGRHAHVAARREHLCAAFQVHRAPQQFDR